MSAPRLIECVPNFSEGSDMALIGRLTGAIEAVDGVRLLDVDPGKATNRTVVTFAGSPEAVLDALGWEGDYYSISAYNREGTDELVKDLMQFIEQLPEEEVVEKAQDEEVSFKWDEYHSKQLETTEEDDDWDDWDEDEYDVEVEYRP